MEKEELELFNQKQNMYRHSMSHILAKAIKELYPDVKYSRARSARSCGLTFIVNSFLCFMQI